MSANIKFSKVRPEDGDIPCWAPSHFQSIMREAFGFPCRLTRVDLRKLRKMEKEWGAGAAPNPFTHIIKEVEQHDEIDLWAEH